MVCFARKQSYVGSTSKAMKGRHASRKRKLGQIEENMLVSCEAALRFWNATSSFHDFIPIVYRHAASLLEALAQEWG